VRKVTDDLFWVGANDRRLAMFEGVYSVPDGVSYNSYLLRDDKTVLFDTVDKAVRQRFLENVAYALDGRALDYLIVQHMEPDHSAVMEDVLARYPGVKLVCNAKTLAFIKQFCGIEPDAFIVGEGDTLNTGRHILHFVMAPMVHWPEVMVTYDAADGILFSADAFGTFGALNGALFADEVDFDRDYMDEARRYYANIAGKYGTQAEALLGKASGLAIEMICPLHGFVWRRNLSRILSKYALWSGYQPEEKGVMIAYASVYGNTENAAEILACLLRERGIQTALFDVSVTPASEIIAAAFRWSHLVFASTTYNAGIFVTMEALLNDLAAHNLQNRTAALIENGSWTPASGGLMREILKKCNNITVLGQTVSIQSSLKAPQLPELAALADALAESMGVPKAPAVRQAQGLPLQAPQIDPAALFKLSYGLYVLTAREGDKDNGCIVNTAAQVTESPLRVSVAVNKRNATHDMIENTGVFNISVLAESAPFRLFERFGFQSGRDADKFAGDDEVNRAANGLRYVREHCNGMMAARVCQTHDYGTHSVFVGEVTQTAALSGEASVTYQYYFDNIKPKPQKPKSKAAGFVCRICGYAQEGETLPEDIICPLCKHGAADFEPMPL
jgi:flavorubredoxin/flavin reductase (DIM6/NTAB) family NADH-FMN oxidoreductase RutF